MRHNKKFNHLGRTKAHREAMLANMASSLIMHKRINTTVAKAKELRKFVEPIITTAKNDTTPSRRLAFSYLRDKEAVKELFGTVADKVGDRPGGYTRILRTGLRLGDNASMCFIELVDFNDNITKSASAPKSEARSAHVVHVVLLRLLPRRLQLQRHPHRQRSQHRSSSSRGALTKHSHIVRS